VAIRQQLDDDIKAALLAGDSVRVVTLRGLKSAVLYADVAAGKRNVGGVDDEEVLAVLAKEAKKRQESADLYVKGGRHELADRELLEKKIIEDYLPKQLSDDELGKIVDDIIKAQSAEDVSAMGRVINAVKARVGNTADGARIASLVRERIVK